MGTTGSYDYMVTGNHGMNDMWLIKTDKNGTLKWERCLGSPNNEGGYGICNAPFGYIAYGETFPGDVGQQDAWVFALDTMSDTLSNLQFGGTAYEYTASIMPFKGGYAAVGYSSSDSFTTGINIGHAPGLVGDAFVTYLNNLPLTIQNLKEQNQHLQIFPNPTNRTVNIIVPHEEGNLTIMNCFGEKIYSDYQNARNIEVNTIDWAKGIYIVRWQGEDGSELTKKFIKA